MGAWIETFVFISYLSYCLVAPYVGAWIETDTALSTEVIFPSHPTWVRGLKLLSLQVQRVQLQVAPYVGAWIETILFTRSMSIVRGRTLRGCVD